MHNTMSGRLICSFFATNDKDTPDRNKEIVIAGNDDTDDHQNFKYGNEHGDEVTYLDQRDR